MRIAPGRDRTWLTRVGEAATVSSALARRHTDQPGARSNPRDHTLPGGRSSYRPGGSRPADRHQPGRSPLGRREARSLGRLDGLLGIVHLDDESAVLLVLEFDDYGLGRVTYIPEDPGQVGSRSAPTFPAVDDVGICPGSRDARPRPRPPAPRRRPCRPGAPPVPRLPRGI